MNYEDKTKKELIDELIKMQKRIAQLERVEKNHIEARRELSESVNRYRQLTENIRDIVFVQDMNLNIVYSSPSVMPLFGYTEEEVLKLKLKNIMTADSLKRATENFLKYVELAKRKKNIDIPLMEYEYIRKDGSTFWGELKVAFLHDSKGSLCGSQGILRDITKRKKAEKELKASLKEKEVMLNEIHHRVKNNMQIMSSLIKLQCDTIDNQQLKELCRKSQHRIRSMALVHETLYRSKDLTKIDFVQYVRNLITHLYHSYQINPNVIKLKIEGSDIHLDINRAIPCGLIINEIVTNSLKFAFPKGRKGMIAVKLSGDEKGKYRLEVRDSGVGIPVGVNIRNPDTLGLQLVKGLVKQIGGSMKLDRKGGTTFQTTF